jgi:hypothetical protein
MAKLRLAITAAVLAAMPALAAAQGLSYEGRGYGGPLYIGPNFKDGSQRSIPVYEPGAPKKSQKKKRSYRAAKPHKKPDVEETQTAKGTTEKGGIESENSSISRAADGRVGGSDKTDTAAVQNENSSISATKLSTAATAKGGAPSAPLNIDCKKYFPTAGVTLSVACE